MFTFTRKSVLMIFLSAAISELTGCSSISSELVCGPVTAKTKNPACSKQISLDDGIVYYLPSRRIRLDVSVAGEKADEKDITVKMVNNLERETYPDPNQIFVLRYNKNYIGANNMAVGVNSFGLLTVTHANTINKINEIAANAGASAASLMIGAGTVPSSDTRTVSTAQVIKEENFKAPDPPSILESTIVFKGVGTSCQSSTKPYTVLIDPKDYKEEISVCGVTIELEKIFADKNADKQNGSSRIMPINGWVKFRHFLRRSRNVIDVVHTQNTLDSVPGIFYKHDLPYYVIIKRKNAIGTDAEKAAQMAKFIAMSPNESKIYFAPIIETVFTDNTSDITVVNGVVNTLKENTDSELLALSKLPADVLGGYTGALGKIFDSQNNALDKQQEAEGKQLLVLSNAQKVARCQLAIAINNPSDKAGDPVALATAFANINAACPGK